MCFFLVEKDVFLTARRRNMCFLLIEKDVFFLGYEKSWCFDGRASGRSWKKEVFRAAEGGAWKKEVFRARAARARARVYKVINKVINKAVNKVISKVINKVVNEVINGNFGAKTVVTLKQWIKAFYGNFRGRRIIIICLEMLDWIQIRGQQRRKTKNAKF